MDTKEKLFKDLIVIYGNRIGIFNAVLILFVIFFLVVAVFMFNQSIALATVNQHLYKIENSDKATARAFKILIRSWSDLERMSHKLDQKNLDEAIFVGEQILAEIQLEAKSSINERIKPEHNDSLNLDNIYELSNLFKVLDCDTALYEGYTLAMKSLSVAVYDRLSKAYYEKGRYSPEKNIQRAIFSAREITRIDTTFWRGYRFMALSLWRDSRGSEMDLGTFHEIETAFNKSINLQNDFNIDNYNLVEFYFVQSKFKKALQKKSELFTMRTSIPEDHEAERTMVVIEVLSKYILSEKSWSSSKILDQCRSMLNSTGDKIEQKHSDMVWGSDFMQDFSECVKMNENIPKNKRKTVLYILNLLLHGDFE